MVGIAARAKAASVSSRSRLDPSDPSGVHQDIQARGRHRPPRARRGSARWSAPARSARPACMAMVRRNDRSSWSRWSVSSSSQASIPPRCRRSMSGSTTKLAWGWSGWLRPKTPVTVPTASASGAGGGPSGAVSGNAQPVRSRLMARTRDRSVPSSRGGRPGHRWRPVPGPPRPAPPAGPTRSG